MKIEISDYEAIRIVADDQEYELKKLHIGLKITKLHPIDDITEPIEIKQKTYEVTIDEK